jgi:signal transduction histidine kinase
VTGEVGRELRPRSLLFDLAVALLFVAIGLVLLEVFTRTPDAADRFFVVTVNLPLTLRRRLPRVAFGVAFAFGFAQMVLDVPVGMHDAGLLFALYSVVGTTAAAFGRIALGVGLLAALTGGVTGWWSWVDRQLITGPGPGVRLLTTAGAVGLVLATWALGRRYRSARLGQLALAERADQLQREQEQRAALAAADERARIAREMHDVVAHGLSVMVVQADGAAYVVDQDPARAREALAEISRTGRESMAQMRSLLGLLREESTAPRSTLALADLDALVAEARRAGSAVELTRRGSSGYAALVELTAYRVVQEGLTNARKHGGPAVAVDLVAGPDALVITVTSDPPSGGSGALTQEPGHGLTGLRERVAAVDGTLETTRADDGAFTLRVRLPANR